MTTYIAFLRGINVTGHKIIKMEALRMMFESMGFKNVRTYIQSGNVKFETGNIKSEELTKRIESKLKNVFGYDVIVVTRTEKEIEEIIKGYPFSKVKDHDKCRIHVAFLSGEPGRNEVKELISFNTYSEMYNHKGANTYILLRGGMADSLTGKNIIEKKLKVRATIRNWNTVNKMLTV